MRRVPFVATFLLVVCAAAAVAQDTTMPGATRDSAAGTSRRSPALARVIGIVPGAGHFYAGEGRTGLKWFGAMGGVLLVGGAAAFTECLVGALSDEGESCPHREFVWVLTGGAFAGVWGWSIYDAGRAAQRTNTRRGLSISGIIVERFELPTASSRSRTGFKLGVSIASP